MSETPHLQGGEQNRESSQGSELPFKERVLQSADLFQGRREVLILHEGEAYRLRLTKNGKLILHK
jgi:hemin uptake protein HemP